MSIIPQFKKHTIVLSYSSVDGEGNGTPLQYFCLENPMGRGTWWAAVRVFWRSPVQVLLKSRGWQGSSFPEFHPCSLSPRHFQLLSLACCPLTPSSKPVRLQDCISLTIRPYLCLPHCTARKASLFFKNLLTTSVPPGQPGIFSRLKVLNLNHICKVSFVA